MLTKNVDESQVVLLIAASDLGAYKRKGQKEGAKEIYKLIKSMDSKIKILDYGELFLNHFDLKEMHETIENEISKVKQFGKPVILIGGDHSVSYGAMKNFPESQIYMFDAHPDLIDENGVITHGSFLREFSDHAKLLGIRYKTKQEENEMKNLKEIDTKSAYISIDLDVLDPKIMPGVSHPVNGGWSLEKLKSSVEKVFEEKRVVCLDITEFSVLVEKNMSLKTIRELLDFLFQKFLRY